MRRPPGASLGTEVKKQAEVMQRVLRLEAATKLFLERFLAKERNRRLLQAVLDHTGIPTYADVQRALGVSHELARKKLLMLGRRLVLGLNVDPYALRLRVLVLAFEGSVEADRLPFLDVIGRSYYRVLAPRLRTFVAYNLPFGYEPDDLLRLLPPELRSRVSEQLVLDHMLYSRPRLEGLLVPCEDRVRIRAFREDVGDEVRRAAERPAEPQVATPVPHIDMLDLLILRQLEIRGPFMTVTDLADALKVSRSKVTRHLSNHLLRRGVIRGVRMRVLPFETSSSYYFKVVIRGDRRGVWSVANSLMKEFGAMGALLGGEGVAMLYFKVPYDEVGGFREVAEVLGRYFDASVHTVDPWSVRRYTLPFLAYNQERRQWDLSEETISRAVRKLKALGTG